MKKFKIVYLILLLALLIGCKKDEAQPDYASKITGTYNGSVTVVGSGTVTGSSTLSKNTETTVDLKIVIGSSSIPLDGISVSSPGGDVYNLSFSDSSGSFDGKVEGNKFTWTMVAGSIKESFSGTK